MTERRNADLLTQHAHYELLCALAAAGQITPDELATLRDHTRTCQDCCGALADFSHIGIQLLPEHAGKQHAVSPEMTSRFIAQARSEGVPLSQPKSEPGWATWLPSIRLYAEFAGTALLLVLGWPYLMSYWQDHRPAKNEDHPSVLLDQHLAADYNRLNDQLQHLQAQVRESSDQLASKKAALEAARIEIERLESRLAQLETTDERLQQELTARNTEIADLSGNRDQLRADMESLRSAKATEDLLFRANRSEMEDLRVKVAELTEEVNEHEQLSEAAEQAKDLIVARNLHIVDVHDNVAGKRPHPFGRIFYTEGKKLIFYAYDLGDTKANAKVTFYVWGERSGTTEEARHLGILHADDKHDGRWVVTFDDSKVLAEINTVFVTAESPRKEPNKPSNNRILSAFLGGTPNHP